MKELSIEEKAKRYDEAIKKAESLYKASEPMSGCNVIVETLFPELKESEDERIRKWLIELVEEVRKANPTNVEHNGMCSEALAWIEKQAEQKPKFRVGDTIRCKYDDRQFTIKSVDLDKGTYTYTQKGCGNDIDYADEEFELVEQKPADKIEPKFKIGDFIVNDYCMGKVIELTNDTYLLDTGQGIPFSCEHNAHLWTIQDAKDGDVLATSAGAFIYNDNNGGGSCPGGYCGINTLGEFKTGVKHHWTGKKYPATKEQRDTLMKAMADAGYTFDFESKELKKIEYKHICELDNSYACVTFPFKAKVKSSGAIVTIHDGQLSPDGKEWIKYQSDAEDRYKVYEPNNLELVCEIEQKPAWSEEDEKRTKDIKHRKEKAYDQNG